jgi:hypothetical protein
VEREHAFAEALVALRLALGGLEAACEDDPARYRRATATLERVTHEVGILSAPREDDLL